MNLCFGRRTIEESIDRGHTIEFEVGKYFGSIVTHDLDEAMKLGDRIAVLVDGHFVQCIRLNKSMKSWLSIYS